jgi:hypothetical protein
MQADKWQQIGDWIQPANLFYIAMKQPQSSNRRIYASHSCGFVVNARYIETNLIFSGAYGFHLQESKARKQYFILNAI